MKYKIGEISKILDVPVETIRFYESKGLIHPQKDKDSNYRYYDYWDINLLFDYKKYRDLEFSLAESLEIIKESRGANNPTLREKFSAQAIFSYHAKR